MNYTVPEEIKMNDELNALFSEWKKELKSRKISNKIIKDGFYPFYTQQKKKILFVGRESLGMDWCESFTEEAFEWYKNNEINGKSLDSYKFHSMLFYVAYSLLNPMKKYADFPYASELAKDFGTENGLSFAFINISKFSNESKDWQKDDELISSFVDNASDFIEKQIAILNPDIVITMNLGKNLEKCGELTLVDESNPDAFLYDLKINGENRPLVDAWHFSALGKSAEKNYITPIRAVLSQK